MDRLTSAVSHLQGVEHDLAVQRVRHRPAHDGAGEDVGNAGQVQKAFARLDVLDVGHPDLVRALGHELAIDEVGGRRCLNRAPGGLELAPAPAVLDAQLPHQAQDALTRATEAVVEPQLSPDPGYAVGTAGAGMDGHDEIAQALVLGPPSTLGSRPPGVVAAARDPEQLAHPTHLVVGLLSLR